MKNTEKINHRSVQKTTTLIQALKRMDELDKKLLLVFDEYKYVGLLSVGDIQRAIIKNQPLNSEISSAMRKNIRVCHQTDSIEKIRALMLEYRTECMPVLDGNNELFDLIFWEDEFSENVKNDEIILNIPVVIMAGGLGTRMRPLTNVIPKPLIPLKDKTIIETIIHKFSSFGADKFYLTVNYKHEMIKQYLDVIPNKPYSVEYFLEDKPLGTAGSLKLLTEKIKSTFFVSNCDILIEQDYREIYKYHIESKNEITLVGSVKNFSIPYGTLETGENGQLLKMKEKPDLTFLINSGLYILEPTVFKDIPEGQMFHITHLIECLMKQGRQVGVFPVSEKSWYDIGEWDEYLKTLRDYKA